MSMKVVVQYPGTGSERPSVEYNYTGVNGKLQPSVHIADGVYCDIKIAQGTHLPRQTAIDLVNGLLIALNLPDRIG